MSNVKVQKLFVQWLGSLKKCFTFNKCRYVFFPSDDFFFIKKYLNSIFQVRKLSNCLSHPMHFFHTDYVLLKKFNFVLYVDISYWQLQVGPDLPRPDEPQRILIHWPVLPKNNMRRWVRVINIKWGTISYILQTWPLCHWEVIVSSARKRNYKSKVSITSKHKFILYYFFLFSFYLAEVVAIIMTPIFSSASSTYNLFMWVHTLFNLGAYKY